MTGAAIDGPASDNEGQLEADTDSVWETLSTSSNETVSLDSETAGLSYAAEDPRSPDVQNAESPTDPISSSNTDSVAGTDTTTVAAPTQEAAWSPSFPPPATVTPQGEDTRAWVILGYYPTLAASWPAAEQAIRINSDGYLVNVFPMFAAARERWDIMAPIIFLLDGLPKPFTTGRSWYVVVIEGAAPGMYFDM